MTNGKVEKPSNNEIWLVLNGSTVHKTGTTTILTIRRKGIDPKVLVLVGATVGNVNFGALGTLDAVVIGGTTFSPFIPTQLPQIVDGREGEDVYLTCDASAGVFLEIQVIKVQDLVKKPITEIPPRMSGWQ